MTLVIDVQALLRVSGSSIEVNATGLPEELETRFLDYDFVGPLRFRGKMANASTDVLELTGKLTFRVHTQCARCLREVERDFDVDMEESFIGEGKPKHAYEHLYRKNYRTDELEDNEEDSEEDDAYTFEGEEVSLSDALKDNALLALPPRLLCEEDCPGLCPHCGRRRDDPECHCEEDNNAEESPFSVLKDLI